MLTLYRAEWRRRRRVARAYKAYHMPRGVWPPPPEVSGTDVMRWGDEVSFAAREYQALATRHLIGIAIRRGIEVPEDTSSSWTTLFYAGDEKGLRTERALTDAALARLRRLIREDFRVTVKWWVDILTPIATIVGTLAGVWLGAHISVPKQP